jgi:hypothetical protein
MLLHSVNSIENPLLKRSDPLVFVYVPVFCRFCKYLDLGYVVGTRIKLTLQEVGIEVRERSKACRGEGDTWKKPQTCGGEGYMKRRIGLKHLVAVCSPELRIPMSELKAVVDIGCDFKMLDFRLYTILLPMS